MKEFRVAKCLINGKIDEYAIFKDGSRQKLIETDEKYGKFFYVDNELNTECQNRFLKYSFNGRIKDAVETIISGNGDSISSFNMFGNHIKVVYFLDRKIGEELRKKTIEGWKNSKFGYAITYGYKSSFLGYSFLTEDLDPDSNSNSNKIKMFETEENAENYMRNIIDSSIKFIKDFIEENKDVIDIKKLFNMYFDKIKLGEEYNIRVEFLSEMIDDNFNLLDEKNCKLGYKIVQHVYEPKEV